MTTTPIRQRGGGALSPSSPSSSQTSLSKTLPARNPVALRLYKVLGTNFDDEATREALQTLSELYATTNPAHTTAHHAEEQDEHSVLAERIPGESAARARKNLRRDMERRLAEGSHRFLKLFGELDQKLDQLQVHLTAMRSSCEEAEKQLDIANASSSDLLERAGTLQRERQEVEDKKSIIDLFLSRFTLTEEEAEIITTRGVPVGPQFFKTLDKVEQIQDDCRVLMSGEEGPTKAGLDIMETTSAYLEKAYEKILRWCTTEFRSAGRDIHIEVSSNMKEAIRRLRKRPELLTESLTLLSQTRQTALLSSFLTALTRGGPGGLPRPIELHAHDPMRYVGDMLAWVHQSIAAEREFLESLFAVKGDNRMVGQARDFAGDKGEEEDWIRELMDLSVGRLCPPLKLRVQQTVKSQESSIMSYKIANLLQFYMMTMKRTIGDDAMLSKALQELTDLANQVFFDAITAHSRSLSQMELDLEDPSLTAALPILDHVQILKEILNVYQSSALDESELSPSEQEEFNRVLDAMVDPAVEVIIKKSEEKKAARPKWDAQIFVLNSLTYLLNSLEPYLFTKEKQKKLQETINEHVNLLILDHLNDLLVDSGLAAPIKVIENRETDEPLSRLPDTQTSDLQKHLHTFSNWLSSSSVLESSRLSPLSTNKSKVHQEALKRLARSYDRLCEEVRKPENKYEAGSTLLGSEKPFGQGRLLGQILGLDG